MNENINYENMDSDWATHKADIVDFTKSHCHKGIAFLRINGMVAKTIVVDHLIEAELIKVYGAELIEGTEYWYMPGTSIKYSKIDGEMFNPKCCSNFHPVFLQLKTIEKL